MNALGPHGTKAIAALESYIFKGRVPTTIIPPPTTAGFATSRKGGRSVNQLRMPAISPPHSFYAHNDPSFYENHQNLVHTHYDTGYSTMGTEHRNRPTQAYRSSQSMQLPPLPQPPSLAHKVWILDCRSCKTFFTNRGMKVRKSSQANRALF